MALVGGSVRRHLLLAHRRAFHYASPSYLGAFSPAVSADRDAIRSSATQVLKSAENIKASWHAEPIASLLAGKSLTRGTKVDTQDAFGLTSGSQLLASPSEVDALTQHATTFSPPRSDLREAVRRVEARMLSKHGGALIANQTLDFGKQDGVTEIEEAIQANPVEQRLNDQLWDAEEAGTLVIPRRVALVPCVSNFSHFLDMCRKTLRLVEVGVPVMVLSRSHTSQYPYRWVAVLAEELAAEGIDPRYLTFCSASLADQQAIIRAVTAASASADADAAPTPFLFTGARQLAAAIKRDVCDGVVASTQGPNLMLALGLPPNVAAAAAMSATIENSGQCTALRVLIAPEKDVAPAAVESLFDTTPIGEDASGYLAAGEFAGLLEPPPRDSATHEADAARTPNGYTAHASRRVSYKVRADLPDAPGTTAPEPFEEHWRQVVVDVVTPPAVDDESFVDSVGAWLVKHQPITFTVNGATGDAEHAQPTAPPHYAVARRIFERSALCVYTVGDADVPALTAQARPQDGETFGELPPLGMMADVTRFPMIVPSAQAAYFAHYSRDHLCARATESRPSDASTALMDALVGAASEPAVGGYLIELGEYLRGAAVGPTRTPAARTCLSGLQRPPLDGRLTALRCGELTTLDEVLPFLAPFALTNAAPQLMLSIDPSNDALLDELPRLQLKVSSMGDVELRIHTEQDFRDATVQDQLVRVVRPDEVVRVHPFPLAQQFVSRLMPLGHAKSARSDDQHFLDVFGASDKWLRCL